MTSTLQLRDVGGAYGGLTGKTKTDFGRGDASFVTFLEVINSTRLRGNALGRVRVAKGERQNPVVRGDLLFNGSSETPKEVALSAVVDFDPDASTFLNSFCFGFRLRPNAAVDSTYLAYFFRSSVGRSLVASLAQGATRYNIAKTKLLDVELTLPSVERQREIVDSLTDADDLIDGLKRMIAKKEAIKQGVLQELLSGRTRLPGFTGEWVKSTVGAVGDVRTGPFGSSLHERDYVSQGTPIITVEHLGERGIEGAGAPMVSDVDRHRLRVYRLAEGDVIFSRVGSIDRNAMVSATESGWLFSGRLLRVRFDTSRAGPAFMSAQFQSRTFTDAVRAVAVGQTMPSLNTTILKGIAIDLPPIDEQRAIGHVSTELNAELDLLDRRLRKANDVKQGLMQELLTGGAPLPSEAAS
jgi:hypothetical protein